MAAPESESQRLVVSFAAVPTNTDEQIGDKHEVKTYDTFSQHGGVLFYNIPRDGVNPFHGYTDVARNRPIYALTREQGYYVTNSGRRLQLKHYGVPLRDDVDDERIVAHGDCHAEEDTVVQDHWLSWRRHSAYHSKKYLRSISAHKLKQVC